MKKKLVLALILLLNVMTNAQAHHSFNALFNVSETVSVTGEIVMFRFIAPHSYIQLVEISDNESQIMWEIETTTPGMLTRKGITPVTLQAGQIITITGNPTRDGRKLLRLLTIRMPDGKELQIQ